MSSSFDNSFSHFFSDNHRKNKNAFSEYLLAHGPASTGQIIKAFELKYNSISSFYRDQDQDEIKRFQSKFYKGFIYYHVSNPITFDEFGYPKLNEPLPPVLKYLHWMLKLSSQQTFFSYKTFKRSFLKCNGTFHKTIKKLEKEGFVFETMERKFKGCKRATSFYRIKLNQSEDFFTGGW